jgi:hypothetical protein
MVSSPFAYHTAQVRKKKEKNVGAIDDRFYNEFPDRSVADRLREGQ